MSTEKDGMVPVIFTQMPYVRMALKTRQGHFVTMSSEALPIPQGITVWVPGKEGEPITLEQMQEALRQVIEATIAVFEPIIVREHVRVESGAMHRDHVDKDLSL